MGVRARALTGTALSGSRRHAVWLYHRFTLSFRYVEGLLAERGVTVSYEAIRFWCRKFGPAYARTLRRRQGRLGDMWHVDELFITIPGERYYLYYLWRAVDQDGDVLDILVTRHRDRKATTRFFRKVLKQQGKAPWQLVTDKLRSYVGIVKLTYHKLRQPQDMASETASEYLIWWLAPSATS